MNDYVFLTESELHIFEIQEDIDFLLNFKDEDESLIKKSGDRFKIQFVGEVKTPTRLYFSFPKNMISSSPEENKKNKDLIKSVLEEYRNDSTGKRLVITSVGSYTPERAYFEKLKEYFLDYITYEFIYPLKKKKVHSTSPVSGGRVSVLDTVRNRQRYGVGVTYKTKDVVNSDDWMLDDIYLFTLYQIQDRIQVTPEERKQISDMVKYLEDEGYSFNNIVGSKIISKETKKELLDLTDDKAVEKAIQKSEVGVIHYPIKEVLLEYYVNKQKAAAKSSVNVIFTKNFEKVWEQILQDALQSSSSFKSEYTPLFRDTESEEKFIPESQLEISSNQDQVKYKEKNKSYKLVQETDPEYQNLKSDKDEDFFVFRNGRYFFCEAERTLIPDIFVELDQEKNQSERRRFIGDAKYYKDPSDANYDKEFYLYNDAQNNKYPMVVFAIPETENLHETIVPRRGYRRSGDRELILITVCVKDVINDALRGTTQVLDKATYLIKKYTRKLEWRDS